MPQPGLHCLPTLGLSLAALARPSLPPDLRPLPRPPCLSSRCLAAVQTRSRLPHATSSTSLSEKPRPSATWLLRQRFWHRGIHIQRRAATTIDSAGTHPSAPGALQQRIWDGQSRFGADAETVDANLVAVTEHARQGSGFGRRWECRCRDHECVRRIQPEQSHSPPAPPPPGPQKGRAAFGVDRGGGFSSSDRAGVTAPAPRRGVRGPVSDSSSGGVRRLSRRRHRHQGRTRGGRLLVETGEAAFGRDRAGDLGPRKGRPRGAGPAFAPSLPMERAWPGSRDRNWGRRLISSSRRQGGKGARWPTSSTSRR